MDSHLPPLDTQQSTLSKHITFIAIAFVGGLIVVVGIAASFVAGRGWQNIDIDTSSPTPTPVTLPSKVTYDYLTPTPLTVSTTPSPSTASGISINFAACETERRRVDTSFGSTTYEVKGKKGVNCVLHYGGEVENPNSNGELPTQCMVPLTVGTAQFAKNEYGVDFSPIARYCSTPSPSP
jgi:hypothetical protein